MSGINIPLPLKMIITVKEDGLNVSGPIDTKFLCDGLIAGAKRHALALEDHQPVDVVTLSLPLTLTITYTREQQIEVEWPCQSRFVCDAILEGARTSVYEYLQRKQMAIARATLSDMNRVADGKKLFGVRGPR